MEILGQIRWSVSKPRALKRLFQSALCAVIALYYAGQLSAQMNATGTISGQITDSSGTAVANGQVKVVEQETQVPVTKIASTNGLYTFPLLKAGVYSVEAGAPGFATMISKGLVLQIQQVI